MVSRSTLVSSIEFFIKAIILVSKKNIDRNLSMTDNRSLGLSLLCIFNQLDNYVLIENHDLFSSLMTDLSNQLKYYLRSLKNDSESGERIVQELLVHFRVQVADENVGTDVQVLLVSRGLVDANGLAK